MSSQLLFSLFFLGNSSEQQKKKKSPNEQQSSWKKYNKTSKIVEKFKIELILVDTVVLNI